MGKRLIGTLAVLMALVVLMPASVLAQGTTGTIRGKVTDQATGEPLAAVNVTVLEANGTITQMGAFSNAEGDYVIINVPPDRYTLRATMMGYKTYEVTEMLVTVGVSTTRDFQLEATVLDVGEVVTIVAERDLIQRDVTATQQSYSIEEMEKMAVRTTSDILALQTNTFTLNTYVDEIPGYNARGLEQVHMRGGRNAEVAFMIDGMQVTNLVFGGQAATVSPFSLSEMVVMAGGMSAEFGNAMSGVVNMVTREGGSSYDANVELSSSEISGLGIDDARDQTAMSGYIGGPIPVMPRLTFFASGSANNGRSYIVKKDDVVFDLDVTDDPSTWNDPGITYDPVNPYAQRQNDLAARRIWAGDIYSGYLGYGFENGWDGMLNVTYKLNPSMKMTVSGQKNGRYAVPYTDTWRWSMLWGMPADVQHNLVWGTPRYDATSAADIAPNTGLTDFQNEKNLLFLDNMRLAYVWTHQLNQSTFYSLRGSYYDYNRTMRVKRWVNDDGYAERFEHYYPATGDTLWRPGDAMTQVTLGPFPYSTGNYNSRAYGYVAIGGAGLGNDASDRYWTDHFDETRTLKGDVTSQSTTHHQLKTGFLYNQLSMRQHDIQLLYLTPPYIVDYYRMPWEMGLYVQDKVEYDFLILNIGLRYDAANAGKVPFWVDPRNPIDPVTGQLVINPADPEQAPVLSGELRSQVSPRFGISHPVTDQAVVYFNYGEFYQNPIYRNLYIQGTLEDSVPLIGNPNMENEKTVSYEFGYKHQFTELWALEATMYAKDTSNMVGSESIPAFFQGVSNPYDYTVFLNYDYSSSKGVDLTLRKRYSNFWQGQVNYSFMTTQSNRDDPWSGYRSGDELETAPKRPRVLGWDQPHRVSANLSLSLPEGAGPEWFGIRPLQKSTASIIYRAAAGKPYTPSTKEKTLEPNSGRRPWTFQWDMKLYRDFESFGLRYSLFADVRNLFDRVNVTSVFSRTGKPNDPGPSATGYTDQYEAWHNYGTPRTISVGLRIFF